MNSRERKVKFLGLISFLNALPVWAIPKGSCLRVATRMVLKSTKMGWHDSARRYALCSSSKTGPTYVCIIRLKSRGSVRLWLWQDGHSPGTGSWSTRQRF